MFLGFYVSRFWFLSFWLPVTELSLPEPVVAEHRRSIEGSKCWFQVQCSTFNLVASWRAATVHQRSMPCSHVFM